MASGIKERMGNESRKIDLGQIVKKLAHEAEPGPPRPHLTGRMWDFCSACMTTRMASDRRQERVGSAVARRAGACSSHRLQPPAPRERTEASVSFP